MQPFRGRSGDPRGDPGLHDVALPITLPETVWRGSNAAAEVRGGAERLRSVQDTTGLNEIGSSILATSN
eukprot:CAMPEP_0172801512 /NCGR_PEP_ID=MMETSP1075-20121228/3245_1 /TAXON_ID=2916 /ORGANISM="Ceratium fusus, Strain PA161109" /LENGTH=68 /DNA_ID=CAMNT_0013639583 /DNA_START=297 /DNA_END=503 /DNA_ORIENTATION=-